VLQNVERGVFQIPFQISRSAASVRSIMRKYRNLPADFADACMIQLADELNAEEILTLDGDFKFYRWHRNRMFRLLVSLD
jgi:predicted nucleic acid-binding protein